MTAKIIPFPTTPACHILPKLRDGSPRAPLPKEPDEPCRVLQMPAPLSGAA